jgi:hypothetical protein
MRPDVIAQAVAMLAAGCRPGHAKTALTAKYGISERSAQAVIAAARRQPEAQPAVTPPADPAPAAASTTAPRVVDVVPDDLAELSPSAVHKILQARLMQIVSGPLTVLTGKNVVAAAKELARLNGLHTERHLHLHLRQVQGELFTPAERCRLIADQMAYELGLADRPPELLRASIAEALPTTAATEAAEDADDAEDGEGD